MDLMAIEPQVFVFHVVIAAFATLGCVEFLKVFFCPKTKKKVALMSLGVLILHVSMQMPWIDPVMTGAWNLIGCGIALIKFGHTALVKVPELMIGKAFGDQQPTGFNGSFGMQRQGFGGHGWQAGGVSMAITPLPPPGCPNPMQYQ